MGGAEALYCILRSPELLLLNIVDRVVLIDPAIGGSVLADHMDISLRARAVRYYLGAGLESLRPEVAHANFEAIYQVFQEKLKSLFSGFGEGRHLTELQRLSARVFYVRSSVSDSETLSRGIRVVHAFTDYGELQGTRNDGLLDVKEQLLNVTPAFGTDFGILTADHLELVIAGMFSRSNAESRMAFTRAILQGIYSQ